MAATTSLSKQDSKTLYFIVFVLFFFSGMSGLIYQIVWTRMLVLIFGNTMLATSTVLSAFMAGLAAGSYVFGKYADKRPRGLLRVYALLEAGIGVFALIFPLLLSVVGPVYTSLYQSLSGNMIAINFIRFIICFVLIVVPTFLMGATLPVLIKRFARRTRAIGREMGFLYGLNTAGAVAGSMVCGFLFLKLMGMRLSTLVAVAINFLVALLAWFLGKEETNAKEPQKIPHANITKDKKETPRQGYNSTTVKWVLVAIGISGFCALAYEVFWTRMLNLFFHNTVYSFTTILATFLTGIAIGSIIYSKFLSGIKNKVRLFVFVEIGIGVLSYAAPFVFNLLYSPVFSKSAGAFTIIQAAVIMIGPTILMGIALPLAVQICQRGPQREGDSVGTVYAVNTIGSIIGAFAAGFLLMPNLGIQKSVVVIVSFNILAGFLVLFSTVQKRTRWIYGFSLIVILLVSFIAAPSTIFRNLYKKKQATADLMYYKEGKIANVVVYDFYKNGYKDLYLNGIEEASSRLWHVQLFKMLGALPTVVHHQPDDAIMIAFGAGMSAGTCIDLVNHFECAELNPDIFEEAKIFKKENRDVIHNPKLNMVFNDGRNHLLLSPKKYSLIISDATNPLTFDSWTLYTKEFYELCKQKTQTRGRILSMGAHTFTQRRYKSLIKNL
jgi:spermidine synthase